MMAAGLEALGVNVVEFPDGWRAKPVVPTTIFVADDDHRIVMASALVGAGDTGVRLGDPDCVASPQFHDFLEGLVADVQRAQQ